MENKETRNVVDPKVDIERDKDTSTVGGWNLAEVRQELERADCVEAATGSVMLVANMFALMAWHVAELLQIPIVVVSPYPMATAPPHWFEASFRGSHPRLFRALKLASTPPPRYPWTSAMTATTPPPTSARGCVSWAEVTHWMWPLFSDSLSRWRLQLGLTPVPFTVFRSGAGGRTHHPSSSPARELRVVLPRAPLLLFGVSPGVLARPGFWAPTVRLTGFWFVEDNGSCASNLVEDESGGSHCAQQSYPVLSPSLRSALPATTVLFSSSPASRPTMPSPATPPPALPTSPPRPPSDPSSSPADPPNPTPEARERARLICFLTDIRRRPETETLSHTRIPGTGASGARRRVVYVGFGSMGSAGLLPFPLLLARSICEGARRAGVAVVVQASSFDPRAVADDSDGDDRNAYGDLSYAGGGEADDELGEREVTPPRRESERILNAERPTIKRRKKGGQALTHTLAAQTVWVHAAAQPNSCVLILSSAVDHSFLFKHVDVVLHHGGSGTTAACLRAGVPQVLCPIMFDQFFWARQMEWLGVGVNVSLRPRPPSAAYVATALRKVLGGRPGDCSSRNDVGSKMVSCEMVSRARELGVAIRNETGLARAVAVIQTELQLSLSQSLRPASLALSPLSSCTDSLLLPCASLSPKVRADASLSSAPTSPCSSNSSSKSLPATSSSTSTSSLSFSSTVSSSSCSALLLTRARARANARALASSFTPASSSSSLSLSSPVPLPAAAQSASTSSRPSASSCSSLLLARARALAKTKLCDSDLSTTSSSPSPSSLSLSSEASLLPANNPHHLNNASHPNNPPNPTNEPPLARSWPSPQAMTMGGKVLWVFGLSEAVFVHREIFVDKMYFQRGVQLPQRTKPLCRRTISSQPSRPSESSPSCHLSRPTCFPPHVVFDVGANVGLFSLFVHGQSQVPVHIFAFEPAPPNFKALRRNLESHCVPVISPRRVMEGEECRRGGVSLFRVALADTVDHDKSQGSRVLRKRELTFFPRMGGNSTMHPAEKRAQVGLLCGTRAAWLQGEAATSVREVGSQQGMNEDTVVTTTTTTTITTITTATATTTTTTTRDGVVLSESQREALSTHTATADNDTNGKPMVFKVPTTTVSTVLDAYPWVCRGMNAIDAKAESRDWHDALIGGIDDIDEFGLGGKLVSDGINAIDDRSDVYAKSGGIHLLKIDVEGCELEVLRGVRPEHWPFIHSVSMEVQNFENRLSDVVALLQDARCGAFDSVSWVQTSKGLATTTTTTTITTTPTPTTTTPPPPPTSAEAGANFHVYAVRTTTAAALRQAD